MGKNLKRNLYQWAAIVTLQYRSINLDMFRRLPKPAIQSVQTSLSPRPARLILRNVCGLQPNFITFICKLVNQSKHPVSLNRKRSAFSCISRQHSQKLISTWSDIPCPHLNRPSLGSAMYIKNRVAANCSPWILCKLPATSSLSSRLPGSLMTHTGLSWETANLKIKLKKEKEKSYDCHEFQILHPSGSDIGRQLHWWNAKKHPRWGHCLVRPPYPHIQTYPLCEEGSEEGMFVPGRLAEDRALAPKATLASFPSVNLLPWLYGSFLFYRHIRKLLVGSLLPAAATLFISRGSQKALSWDNQWFQLLQLHLALPAALDGVLRQAVVEGGLAKQHWAKRIAFRELFQKAWVRPAMW